MTINLNKPLLATVAAVLVTLGAAAKADDFASQQSKEGWSATLDQRAANAQASDPTARDSVRGHGRP